jgi:hypothetical protein
MLCSQFRFPIVRPWICRKNILIPDILYGVGLGTASTAVCFDSEPEHLSPPGFNGTRYDTVQTLKLIGGPRMDVMQLNVQKLNSLLEVICLMRCMHIA